MVTQHMHMFQRLPNDQGGRQRSGDPSNSDESNSNNPRMKRKASQVAIGHITTGAENDLQRVTAIARQMVTRWGMSERLGTISFSEREDPFAGPALATGSREYSEQTAIIIDEEVNRIVKWAYDRAVHLLTEQRETLDRLARSLRLHETLDAKQMRALLEETGAMRTRPL